MNSISDTEASQLSQQRQTYRTQMLFIQADAIRSQLLQAGIVVFDTHNSTTTQISSNNNTNIHNSRSNNTNTNPKNWMRIQQKITHPNCMCWSHRQQKFCSTSRYPGEWFCEDHCLRGGLKARVPCPLDPRHHLKPAKVQAHLTVCQNKPGSTAMHNTVTATTATSTTSATSPDTIQAAEVARLVHDALTLDSLKLKIDGALRALNALNNTTNELNPLPKEHLYTSTEKKDMGVRKRKEEPQNKSIVHHLLSTFNANEVNEQNIIAIECCAGKGKLSQTLQHELCTQCVSPSSIHYYMVDRAVRRKCVDDGMRTYGTSTATATATATKSVSCPSSKITRLIIDVATLSPSSLVDQANEEITQVWMYGKHLCGAATDLTLRVASSSCSQDMDQDVDQEVEQHQDYTTTMTAAACCHHLCTWKDVLGQEILTKHGISSQDFAIMKKLCTFYSMGDKINKRNLKNASKNASKKKKKKTKDMTERGRLAALRRDLGIRCKRLINECRRESMETSGHGWENVRLIEYVDASITPENQLLIATRKNNQKKRGETTATTSTTAASSRPIKRRRQSVTTTTAITSISFLSCLFLFLIASLFIFTSSTVHAASAGAADSNEDKYVPPSAPPRRPQPKAADDVIPPTLDTPEIPRSMIETGTDGIGVSIQVGMLVIRGPDWRYGRQDGGNLNGQGSGKKKLYGKVVEIREWITRFNGTDGTEAGDPVTIPGSVRVQWLVSKQVNVYRYGAENKYDIRVVDQNIHDVDWESVMDEMSDDYRLPSQKNSRKNLIVTDEQDILVLKAMYVQMQGYRWRTKIGWLTRFGPKNKENEKNTKTPSNNDGSNSDSVKKKEKSTKQKDVQPTLLSDPCRDKWTGITCNTKLRPARIFAVDLSNNGLHGEIPSNIGNLTHLRTMTLSNNRLTGMLPIHLGACEQLEYFSVEINQLSGSIPQSYGKLKHLKWLSLYNNRLTGYVPKEILRLNELTHVFLQQNQLQGERPTFTSQVLESYQYHQNQFTVSRKRNGL